MLPKKWMIVRNKVLLRDNFTCQMCKEKMDNIELSPHHIIPWKKCHSNKLSNLITLCHPCHEIAEENELNKNEILTYKKATTYETTQAKRGDDWHKWVYGGYRRPEYL